MRRAVHLATRSLLVLLLLAAAVDVPLPAGSRPRRRLHLIDRSASVPRPQDADEVVAYDRGLGGEVLFASFAGDIRFDATAVDDPLRTELRGALEAALGRDPTEIVLHSDGRADPGRALLLCKARGVPVHVYPLGVRDVHDIRFVRVSIEGTLEAVVESTWPVKARLTLDGAAQDVDLAPGAPAVVVFPAPAPGAHVLAITTPDDVPQNDALTIRIPARDGRRRVLALPAEGLPALADVEFVATGAPSSVHAVLVRGRCPDPKAVAAAIRDGVGLLLTGGPAGYAAADWAGTALEEVSPLKANPDHEVSLVFAVDTSGSMKERLREVVDAAEEASRFLGGGVRPMAFSNAAQFLTWEQLRQSKGEGQTLVAHALREAKKDLDQKTGRRHVVLFTDGVTAEKEKPEERIAAARALADAGIGLTILTVDRELEIAKPNLKLKDVDGLGAELKKLFAAIRDTWRESPGPLDLTPHPALAGLGRLEPAGLNLTAAQPGAQIAATWGRAPALYPAIAFGQAGLGKTAAVAFNPDAALLARLIAQVARPPGAYRVSIDPPYVRARGPGISPTLRARSGGVDILLHQVRSDLWEGLLPPGPAGTREATLEDGSYGTGVLACLPEFERLGADPAALAAIAEATGGRLLRGSAELAGLPPPKARGTRSGRPWFLAAALAALFLELAIATFWKAG